MRLIAAILLASDPAADSTAMAKSVSRRGHQLIECSLASAGENGPHSYTK